ncbi:hypothetical protein OG417_36335 [Actinoallomurus sp. NBC_01490]|uniref:hypothetical protein n=1 Tax=Actinoallomurus sp. NBC_01490 TaxID=2903557 RepID=UPI002E333894|nr:hypothetical protein [Actinoallomurus sp. NBC_01490]
MRPAALAWASVYGGFGVVCASTRTPLFTRGPHPGPAGLDWAVVAVAGAAAAAVLSRARALLWGACGLSAVCAFGLLMDVVTLLFGEGMDGTAAASGHALAATGTVLLAVSARRPRPAGPAATGEPPAPASRRVRMVAWAGALAFVPYAAMKTVWATGGTFAGMDGARMLAAARRNGTSGLWLTLESWGVDATALLAALGIFLIFGLVYPWGLRFPRWALGLRGRRVPRWLPLAPALLGAATLAPYGIAGVGYAALGTAGVVTVPRGDFPTSADALVVSWIGLGAFGLYGVALAVAARSYWLRTRGDRPVASVPGR